MKQSCRDAILDSLAELAKTPDELREEAAELEEDRRIQDSNQT